MELRVDSWPLEIECGTVHALQAAGEPFFFCDCREPEEYEVARIAGTALIPMSELRERVADFEPHRDERIVVHCHHGGRSLRVVMWLRQQGFGKAQSLAGGIEQWSQEIDPAIPRY